MNLEFIKRYLDQAENRIKEKFPSSEKGKLSEDAYSIIKFLIEIRWELDQLQKIQDEKNEKENRLSPTVIEGV